MSFDLWLHWMLIRFNIRKKCPHKRNWIVVQNEIDSGTYYICCGCLCSVFINTDKGETLDGWLKKVSDHNRASVEDL